MIDARELSKGNVVSLKGIINVTVWEIGYTGINYRFVENEKVREYEYLFGELEPIPITEKLLLKLGFEKEDDYKMIIGKFFISLSLYSKHYKEWRLQIDDRNNTSVFGAVVQNLHQLQNAIYLATKEELNVNQLL